MIHINTDELGKAIAAAISHMNVGISRGVATNQAVNMLKMPRIIGALANIVRLALVEQQQQNTKSAETMPIKVSPNGRAP